MLHAAKAKIPSQNDFYRQYYAHILIMLMALIFLIVMTVSVVLFQILKRPDPTFYAIQSNGQKLQLNPYNDPNLLPKTVLEWGARAAISAYTFDFSNYRAQAAAARPYFTADGWQDYTRSLSSFIQTLVQNQLSVTSVVDGTPVISNQGLLPDKGYTWRLQIPFLVTYVRGGVSGNVATKNRYYVLLTLVRVPTSVNPQGIGVDQFVMVSR